MPTSILELIEEGCVSDSRLRCLPADSEPRPFSDVWAASERAARLLSNRYGAGACVAGVLTSSPDALATLIGAWRAGVTFASLPQPARAMSPEAYVDQLLRMTKLSDAQVLLIDAAYAALLPDIAIDVAIYEDSVTDTSTAAQIDSDAGELIQFTSGSTAHPKGVRLSLDAIGANVVSILEALEIDGTDSSCVSWLPLSHDMGLIGMTLSTIAAAARRWTRGCELVLIAPEYFLGKPSVWLDCCSEIRASVTGAPDFALRLAVRDTKRIANLDLSSLRSLITGAERVRAQTLRSFESALEPVGLANTTICPAYGLAEASLAVTMVRRSQRWQTRWVDPVALAAGTFTEVRPGEGDELVSNGTPIPGMEVRTHAGVPDAITEIEIRGPSMLTDYVGAPLKRSGDGWFATADRGRLVDGELFIAGRSEELIVLAGRNYFASDLESAAEHEAVRSGNVVALTVADDGFQLVAEPRPGLPPTSLEEACRQIRLQVLRACGVAPASVVFATPGSLAKTPSGKVQRFKVRDHLSAGELPVEARVDFGS